MAVEYDFKGFDNYILQNKIDNRLLTLLDMNQFMTLDESLALEPGMKKIIHTYTGTGEAEDLARGEGNSNFIDAEYTEKEYRVNRTQAQARYVDDDMMTDPVLVEAKIDRLAKAMVDNWTAKAIAEYNKTGTQSVATNFGRDDFFDCVAEYANEYESEEGLFWVVPQAMKPKLRKLLDDELKQTEGYIKEAKIYTICGIPVHFSKALPKDIIFLATKEAVTAFVKKNTFVEQDRDIDTKENIVVASRYSVIALTDETKCIKMGKAQATDATITTYTAGAKAIAGAATTGASVVAYIETVDSETGKKYWAKTGSKVTASSSAYEITADENLASGDKIKVEVELEGFLPQAVVVTVE